MFAFCFLMLSQSLPLERAVCIGIVSRSVEEPTAFCWTLVLALTAWTYTSLHEPTALQYASLPREIIVACMVRCERVILHVLKPTTLDVQFSLLSLDLYQLMTILDSCCEFGVLQRSSTGPSPVALTLDTLTSNLGSHVLGVHHMATQCIA